MVKAGLLVQPLHRRRRGKPSELVANGGLDGSWIIQHGMATASGDPEEGITRIPVNASKSVPVEDVLDIELEQDRLSLVYFSSFDHRGIFVLEAGTTPPGDRSG